MSQPKIIHNGVILGLMSGTSADGLDVAVCDVKSSSKLSFIEGYSFPYPDKLREHIIKLQVSMTENDLNSDGIKQLDQQIADFVIHACQESIEKSSVDRNAIVAIANHGQTILHQPNARKPFSLQIGNAQRIADALNMMVINDFRKDDIKAGGQGAPLIPAFHQAMFQQFAPCNIINIGGIANITSLGKDHIIGFDIGPGNTLLDQWNRLHKNTPFDKNGDWARSGECLQPLLNTLLDEPYFSAPHPKSTGQDLFNLTWLNKKLSSLSYNEALRYQSIAANDIQHTLSLLTAQSIAQTIKGLEHVTHPIFICGGGVHNTHLIEQLQFMLPQTHISSTADIGIDPNWVEAIGFAWLGYCRLNNLTTNIPEVTGATANVCLGTITEPRQ